MFAVKLKNFSRISLIIISIIIVLPWIEAFCSFSRVIQNPALNIIVLPLLISLISILGFSFAFWEGRKIVTTVDFSLEQNEQKLQYTESNFNQTLNHIDEIVTIYDCQLKQYVFVNDAVTSVLGYSREEITAGNIKKNIFIKEEETLMGKAHTIITSANVPNHDSFTALTQVRHKNGSIVYLERMLHPIVENGRVQRIMETSRDITGRVQTELALRKSEAMYRAIVENSYNIICTTDKGGIITYINLAVQEQTGFSPDKIVGTEALSWVADEDRPLIARAIKNIGLGPVQHRFRITGKSSIIETHASPILNERNECQGCLIIANNITRQVRMENRLKTSEEKYRSLYNDAQVGLCTTAMDGLIIMTNPKTAQMFGYNNAAELEGKPAGLLWADPEKRADLMQKLKRDGMVSNYTLEGLCKHDTIKYFELFCRLNPATGYVETNLIDVTEKNRIAQKIQYQSYLLENIQESIVVIDSNGLISYANSRAQQLFGISLEDALGPCLQQRMWPYDRDKINFITRQVKSGQSWHGEIALKFDDQIKHFIHHIDPLLEGSAVTGTVIISTDISALVEARGKAETANMAKSQFLANMSHEIRTPMIGILGSVDLLSELLSGEQLEYLGTIRECGEQLLEIINQILDVSKIELGVLDLNVEPVDLNGLMIKAANIIEPALKAKGLEMKLILDENNGLVMVDPLKLRQVLLNLLYNAVKFTGEGKIALQAQVSESPDNGAFLKVSVTDTGIGISPDQMEPIFAPFTQVDSSYSREYGGTGLGLYICKKMIDLMQGSIGVEDMNGQGTRFSFSIPVGRDIQVNAETGPGASPNTVFQDDLLLDFTPVSILLVEDNELNQKIVTKMLINYGFEVASAANGLECLNILQHNSFDVVLMDMQMPVMDGYEATQAIRRNQNWKDVPIIAMTAHAMAGDREKCLAYGCNSYIAKPFKADALAAEIKKYLNTESLRKKKPRLSNYLINDLLPEFMVMLEEMLDNLIQAVESGNMEVIRSISHDIKGTAGMYGFMDISDAAGIIESLARENKYPRIQLMSRRLYSLYQQINMEVS